MTRHIVAHGRAQLAAVVLALGIPGSTVLAAPVRTAPRPVEVTASDVTATNEKIWQAYVALLAMWKANFTQVGERFATPRISPYRTTIRTKCGLMRPSNAAYCSGDNTIYYDDVFVASQAKAAALELGTDGDMAAVDVIAHEMGHAVAIQLGHPYHASYPSEAIADCLAGAFANQSQRDGLLESGDIDEAVFGMASGADPTPESTGNRSFDGFIQQGIARSSHGTRDQRVDNFRRGLNIGPGACLAEFK